MSNVSQKVPVSVERQKAGRHHAKDTPLEVLRRQVDHLFDDFQRGYWHLPFRQGVLDVEPFWRGQVALAAMPVVDVIETDAGYRLTAELPGVAEKDIEVNFSDGTLTIAGEKQEEKEERKADFFLAERRYGDFNRSFRLPDGVDGDKIEASFTNGVLTVLLPKTADARKRTKTIAIKNA